MSRPLLIALLMVVAMTLELIPSSHGATIECVDNEAQFVNQGWVSTPNPYDYSDTAEGVTGLGGKGVFSFSGVNAYQVLSRKLDLAGASETTFIYVRYYGDVKTLVSQQVFVYPTSSINLMTRLNATTGAVWGEIVTDLSTEAIAVGLQIEVGISNFQATDAFYVDRIAIWHGAFNNGTTNVGAEIDQFCKWGEDESTLAPTTTGPTTTVVTGPTTPPASTTTSRGTAPPGQLSVECIDDDSDFQQSDWASQPAHTYAATSANFPFSKEDEAQGIFYLQGETLRLQRFYNELNFANYEQRTFLYLKYYGHTNSNNTQYAAVFPSNDATLFTLLNPTSGFKWGEALVELYSEALDGREAEIAISNYQLLDFFILDKIAVGHGDLAEGVDPETEIKRVCGW